VYLHNVLLDLILVAQVVEVGALGRGDGADARRSDGGGHNDGSARRRHGHLRDGEPLVGRMSKPACIRWTRVLSKHIPLIRSKVQIGFPCPLVARLLATCIQSSTHSAAEHVAILLCPSAEFACIQEFWAC